MSPEKKNLFCRRAGRLADRRCNVSRLGAALHVQPNHHLPDSRLLTLEFEIGRANGAGEFAMVLETRAPLHSTDISLSRTIRTRSALPSRDSSSSAAPSRFLKPDHRSTLICVDTSHRTPLLPAPYPPPSRFLTSDATASRTRSAWSAARTRSRKLATHSP
jgi:hypothetical protein